MTPQNNKVSEESCNIKSECHHCALRKSSDKYKRPDSLFVACRPFLRILQFLGIFNFSIYDDFSEFECRPLRLIYTLIINASLLALLCGLVQLWKNLVGISTTELSDKFRTTFTSTDCVAMTALLTLLQVRLKQLNCNL